MATLDDFTQQLWRAFIHAEWLEPVVSGDDDDVTWQWFFDSKDGKRYGSIAITLSKIGRHYAQVSFSLGYFNGERSHHKNVLGDKIWDMTLYDDTDTVYRDVRTYLDRMLPIIRRQLDMFIASIA